ncbi:Hint domain-containing protein [Defluviimonas aestuarii]|uniref:Hint domain-containing protein n=1 Tax=Albidovulum aestuarii TaxID=1130726 RepID=UPI00249AE24C|nr:Hint domain-containing protein [Defluviimonas aestuarii]MDI3337267.1 Hint domain-containing protein [Defluviimonas aestuarii]
MTDVSVDDRAADSLAPSAICCVAERGAATKVPHTPCFTGDTEIATDRGAVPIEHLRVGDRVLTRDNGYREVRWIGGRRFDSADLARFPELRPIRIAANSFARGIPQRDLTVSPQHRLLLSGADAVELGGETEILAAAVDLMSVLKAEPADVDGVIYYHIMFDAHEIIWANGCWSESFLPESVALEGLHSVQREEILRIFPELDTDSGQVAYPAARGGLTIRPQLTLVA